MNSLDLIRKTISLTIGAVLLFWMQSAIASGLLSSMRIGQTDDKTRVVFDLKQAQTYQVSHLNNPSRLVVDFFNTKNFLSFKKKHITDSRLFRIRVSDNSKRVRVVLDLHKTPKFKAFTLGKYGSGKERLVVDLTDKKRSLPKQSHVAQKMPAKQAVKPQKPVQTAAVKKPIPAPKVQKEIKPTAVKAEKTVKPDGAIQLAKSDSKPAVQSKINMAKPAVTPSKQSLLTPSKKPTPLVDMQTAKTTTVVADEKAHEATQQILNQQSSIFVEKHDFVIAIDAGHGGKDTGAIGHNKVYEKVATLNMAKELKKVIDRQPGMHAVFTRTKDVFIPLSKRVEIAKQKNADLFISIHADAFHDHSVRGGSVYILSERGASSTMAKLLAKSENASLQEISLNAMDDDVAFALSDLSREATVKESRKLAKTVLGEMKKKVKMHKGSVQSAGFAVLKSIDMPSLLIETAFISNPHEARNLMSKTFQKKMAGAIADGLAEYVDQTVNKPSWGETLFVHYKVQRGDTLSQIAENYDVTTLALKKLNNIQNANSLYVGKKLKIPVSEKYMAGL